MPAAKDDKPARSRKGAGKTAGSKATKPAKSQAKKEGTRVGTMVEVRGAGKKSGGAGSRDRLRDGS